MPLPETFLVITPHYLHSRSSRTHSKKTRLSLYKRFKQMQADTVNFRNQSCFYDTTIVVKARLILRLSSWQLFLRPRRKKLFQDCLGARNWCVLTWRWVFILTLPAFGSHDLTFSSTIPDTARETRFCLVKCHMHASSRGCHRSAVRCSKINRIVNWLAACCWRCWRLATCECVSLPCFHLLLSFLITPRPGGIERWCCL